MIQINLLPDLKKEYLRSQQMKHLVVVGAIFASLLSMAVLTLLFMYVQFVQPRHRANLQNDIDSGIQEMKDKKDAVKIVTVQGVIEQIPALQDKKPKTSFLFNYLTGFTPNAVSYNEVKLDLSTNTLSLTGQAQVLEQTNELANNLKSATFTYNQNGSQKSIKPFSKVVFASLGKAEQTTTNGKLVSFQLTTTLDPIMFDQAITEGNLAVNAASEQLLLPTAQPFSAAPTGATP